MNLPPVPMVPRFEPTEDQKIIAAMPEFVNTERSQYWYKYAYHKIKEHGTPVEKVDTLALGRLACNLMLVEKCEESINTDGIQVAVSGDRGHIVHKKNPALDLLNRAESLVKQYFKEFKMTPQSRGRQLSTGEGSDLDDGFDDI